MRCPYGTRQKQGQLLSSEWREVISWTRQITRLPWTADKTDYASSDLSYFTSPVFPRIIFWFTFDSNPFSSFHISDHLTIIRRLQINLRNKSQEVNLTHQHYFLILQQVSDSADAAEAKYAVRCTWGCTFSPFKQQCAYLCPFGVKNVRAWSVELTLSSRVG